MKKYALILALVFIGSSVYAQVADISGGNAAEVIWTYNYNKKLFDDKDLNQIDGSPYAISAFLPGEVYSGDKVQNEGIFLRYNIYNDILEAEDPSKSDKGPHYTVVKSPRISAVVGGQKYVFLEDFKDENHSNGSYLIQLVEGESISLYKKHSVEFKEAKTARNSYERDQPASFSQSVSYYLVDEANNKLIEIPNRTSKAKRKMEDLKKDSKSFISDNDLDFDDQEDLVKLVRHLNN